MADRTKKADAEREALLVEFTEQEPRDQLAFLRRWKKIQSAQGEAAALLEKVAAGEVTGLTSDQMIQFYAAEATAGSKRPTARIQALKKIEEHAGLAGPAVVLKLRQQIKEQEELITALRAENQLLKEETEGTESEREELDRDIADLY